MHENIDRERLRELAGLENYDDVRLKGMDELKTCFDCLRKCKSNLEEAGAKYPTGTMDDKLNRWNDDLNRTVASMSRAIEEVYNYLNSWSDEPMKENKLNKFDDIGKTPKQKYNQKLFKRYEKKHETAEDRYKMMKKSRKNLEKNIGVK